MKTSHFIIKSIFVIMSSTMLTAGCAKKTDDGKSASARRGSIGLGQTGAQPVNGAASQSALEFAAGQGVTDLYIDIIYQPQVVNQNFTQAIGVESSIQFNGQAYPLVTYHEMYSNGSISQTNSMVAGPFTLLAQGVCGDSNCDTYYVIVTVSKGGSQIIQLAQRQNFNGAAQNTQAYRNPQELINNTQMLFQVLGQPVLNY